MLAFIGEQRISLTPDTATVAELGSDLTVSLWKGLFVDKDTPADVREKIIAVAAQTVLSERVKSLVAVTGALVCWDSDAISTSRITKDIATIGAIDAMLH